MTITLTRSEVERAVAEYVRTICVIKGREIVASVDAGGAATVEIGEARIIQVELSDHEAEAEPTWSER